MCDWAWFIIRTFAVIFLILSVITVVFMLGHWVKEKWL